jgi:hypothetical protein
MAHLIRAFVTLRWRLLRGSLRGSGSEKAGVIVSTVASALVGAGAGIAMAVAGHDVAARDDLFVIFCVVVAAGVAGISVVAGVTQPLDPRVLATEPLSDRLRSLGLLVAAAAGPPGLAGVLMGIGLAIGGVDGAASIVVVVPAVVVWLVTLLLISRTASTALGLLATRYPRVGQILVGIGGLAFYGAFQFVPGVLAGLEPSDRSQLADVLALNPVGQLGRAIAEADRSLPAATVHLVIGTLAVPVLALVFSLTANALATATRRIDTTVVVAPGARRSARAVRRLCGPGGTGAIAWRSILTRFRTPRTALETVTGAGVGLAAVLVPTLVRDEVGGGAVLVGGAVQLAVLFMAGNSFGSDGPALTNELLAGAGPAMLARGKARSIAIVASPLAIIGPVVAAAVTAEWRYLPAGVLVGFGGLLAGTGGAIVQSTFVPVAIPDSDNPFASGESGRGIMAALLLAGVLLGLAIVTLPIALALLWANARGSVAFVTLFGVLTLAAGWGVLEGSVAWSARHLGDRGPEFIAAITPAR